jgi:hypothetical protein
MAKLEMEVNIVGVEEATSALNELAAAAERVQIALGGISVSTYGRTVNVVDINDPHAVKDMLRRQGSPSR